MPRRTPPSDYSVASKYYDLFYSFWEDSGFYVGLAKMTGGPVLDAMCGTGRITIPIARVGADVVGVDLQQKMLDELARKLQDEPKRVRSRVKLVRGDIKKNNLGGPFELAVFAWSSLSEIPTVSEQGEVLKNISAHLKPGGLLAFHSDNPEDVRPTREIFKGVQIDEHGNEISMYQRTVRRKGNGGNSYSLLYRYEIVPRHGRPRELKTIVVLTYPTKRELMGMIREAGFDVLKVYGDYDFRRATRGCKQFIVIARKREADQQTRGGRRG